MKRAFVTMLTGGDAYVPGVEALGHSLRERGSREPCVVMTTPDVPSAAKALLESEGWRVREVKPIDNPRPDDELLFTRFAMTYSKLRAFELVEFDKVVFLDADTLVLRNIDELFGRPAIAAASDFFMPDRFNSGVMVIEPARSLHAQMLKALAQAPTYDGGDQGFLNSYWPGWWAMPVAHRLPAIYNLHHFVFQFLSSQPSLRRQFLDDVKVVHYTLQKPWLSNTVSGGASIWWEQFAAVHPEAGAPWRRRLHELGDWSFDSMVSLLSH